MNIEGVGSVVDQKYSPPPSHQAAPHSSLQSILKKVTLVDPSNKDQPSLASQVSTKKVAFSESSIGTVPIKTFKGSDRLYVQRSGAELATFQCLLDKANSPKFLKEVFSRLIPESEGSKVTEEDKLLFKQACYDAGSRIVEKCSDLISPEEYAVQVEKLSQVKTFDPPLSPKNTGGILDDIYVLYFKHKAAKNPEFLEEAAQRLRPDVEANLSDPVDDIPDLDNLEILNASFSKLGKSQVIDTLSDLLSLEEKKEISELYELRALEWKLKEPLGKTPLFSSIATDSYECLKEQNEHILKSIQEAPLEDIKGLVLNVDLAFLPENVLQRLSSVEAVVISNNCFFVEALNCVKGLPKLKEVYLTCNSINLEKMQEVFPLLEDIEGLEKVDLRGNHLVLEEIPEIESHYLECGIDLVIPTRWEQDFANFFSSFENPVKMEYGKDYKTFLKKHTDLAKTELALKGSGRTVIPEDIATLYPNVEKVRFKMNESKSRKETTLAIIKKLLTLPKLKQANFLDNKLNDDHWKEVRDICRSKGVRLIFPRSASTKQMQSILIAMNFNFPEDALNAEELLEEALTQKQDLERMQFLNLSGFILTDFPKELVGALPEVNTLRLKLHSDFSKGRPVLDNLAQLPKLERIAILNSELGPDIFEELKNLVDKPEKALVSIGMFNCLFNKNITQEYVEAFKAFCQEKNVKCILTNKTLEAYQSALEKKRQKET